METIFILKTNPLFLITFTVCLFSYIFHTLSHFFEYRGKSFTKLPHIYFEIIVFGGHVAWGFMLYLDPIKMNFPDYIMLPIGLLIGISGLILVILSGKEKKGFSEIDHLVTTGAYSKLRNPMYLGLMLIHIGFPVAFQSILTLVSAVIWIPLILIWRYWEEKDLEKKFGKEYLEYKKKTFF